MELKVQKELVQDTINVLVSGKYDTYSFAQINNLIQLLSKSEPIEEVEVKPEEKVTNIKKAK